MPAADTSGGTRRGQHARRRPHAGRTLVAVLGVASLALTAAGAQPLGPDDRPSRYDVFALGADGLGSIGPMTLEGDDDPEAGRDRDRGRDPLDPSTTDGEEGLPALEIPFLGDEQFASLVPGGLGASGIPAPTLRAYRAAAEVLAREAPGCRIDWALLAGIGRVESNHGRFGGATVTDQGVSVPAIRGPRLDGTLANTMVIRDTDGGTLDQDAAYDRAVGPMQFLPGTWQRWGSDGDRDGVSNPQDIDDAALAAARYLCEGRSGLDDPAEAGKAVRRYNNSAEYVSLVLGTADEYRLGGGLGSSGIDDPFGFGDPFSAFDPWGGDLWSPFGDFVPPPPGWQLPPGTAVGAGPLTPSGSGTGTTPTPTPTPTPSLTPSPSPTPVPSSTARPTPTPSSSGTASPRPSATATSTATATPTPTTSGSPTGSPTSSPTATPSGEPSGTPTTPPTTVPPSPTPTEPTPTCDPTPSPSPTASPYVTPSPSVEPSDGATLAPCPPVPCGPVLPSPTPSPTASPTDAPTCAPVEPTGPTP